VNKTFVQCAITGKISAACEARGRSPHTFRVRRSRSVAEGMTWRE